MKAEVRNQIKEANWPRIVRELAVYVTKRVRMTFCVSDSSNMLPEGLSIEDIVQESIKRFFNEDRNWDPTSVDLLPLLKGTARSIIGNLPTSGDNRFVKRNIVIEENETEDEKFSKMKDQSTENTTKSLRNPEQLLFEKRDQQIIIQAYHYLLKQAEGNDDYESVILAICDGFDKPAEISDQTGIELKKVYEFKRRWKKEFEDALRVALSSQKN